MTARYFTIEIIHRELTSILSILYYTVNCIQSLNLLHSMEILFGMPRRRLCKFQIAFFARFRGSPFFFIIYCYVAFFSLGGEELRFTIHVNGTITLHALKTIISPPIYFSRPSTLVTRLLYITFSLLNRTLEIYRIVIIYFSHFRKREIHSRDYSFR